jgi:hypothetical protein
MLCKQRQKRLSGFRGLPVEVSEAKLKFNIFGNKALL